VRASKNLELTSHAYPRKLLFVQKSRTDGELEIVQMRSCYRGTLKAYVLLNTELGKEPEVVQAMKGTIEIKNIYSLYGIYDILVEVEAETMEKVKEVVFNRIRRLDQVKSTITLITYGEPIRNT
jgi:DNA-binding Lrp family transcriptional regulator